MRIEQAGERKTRTMQIAGCGTQARFGRTDNQKKKGTV
jgi:hypothetical protein